MVKTTKETSDRAKTSKCVRLNDLNGLVTKFNKTKFPNELLRELYFFCVKYVEQLARECSPTSVAKKGRFQRFQMVSEGLKGTALPEGYKSFSPKKKEETVKKLVGEVFAAAVSHMLDQGVDSQADSSDHLQVGSGSGSARQLDMTDKEDVDMQVNDPGEFQVDEVPAAAPNSYLGNTFSNDASLLDVVWNLCDNPEGRPPSRPPVPLELLVSIFNDLMHRASRFPGVLPKLDWSEEAFRSFVIQLESIEGACKDRSGTHFRSRQEEFYAPLADFTAYDAVTSLPSMDEMLADEIWSNIGTSPFRP